MPDLSQKRKDIEPGVGPMSEGLAAARPELLSRERAELTKEFKKEGGMSLNPQQVWSELRSVIQQQETVGLEKLEALAVKLVCDEFGIQEGEIIFDAKLVGPGDRELAPTFGTEYRGPDIDDQILIPEVDKRRAANMLIQGGSHMSQLRFLLESEELDTACPDFTRSCKRLMAIMNRVNHSANAVASVNNTRSSTVGLNWITVEDSDNGQTINHIHARAVYFPVLIHELAKCVLESLALWGLPKDENLFEAVKASADKLEYEVGDLKLGPQVWRKVREQLPVRVSARDRSILLMKLFSLPASVFNKLIDSACAGDGAGLNLFFAEELGQQ